MRIPASILFVCLAAFAQTPTPTAASLPNLPDDTVIAVFEDGATFTMGDYRRYYAALPSNIQQVMVNQKMEFLYQFALQRRLALQAEKEKLDQVSPAKEQMEWVKMNTLRQFAVNNMVNSTTITPAEIEAYYQGNKESFKQVKVKAIYIAFGEATPEGKKQIPEDQAKAKAAKLVEQIRGGADFVKLVKENSDDEQSREKDGDYATITPSNNIPDAMKTPLMALKKGEITEPLRQGLGFYILKADDILYQPLEEVRNQIFLQLRDVKARKWMDEQNQEARKTKFPNAEFIGGNTVQIPVPPPAK